MNDYPPKWFAGLVLLALVGWLGLGFYFIFTSCGDF